MLAILLTVGVATATLLMVGVGGYVDGSGGGCAGGLAVVLVLTVLLRRTVLCISASMLALAAPLRTSNSVVPHSTGQLGALTSTGHPCGASPTARST